MLAFIFASEILLIVSRPELAVIPAILFPLCLSGMTRKIKYSDLLNMLLCRQNLTIICLGIGICSYCSGNVLSSGWLDGRFSFNSPYENAVFQLSSNNFSMLLGENFTIGNRHPSTQSNIVFNISIFLFLSGCLAYIRKTTSNNRKTFVISLFAAATYLSIIYVQKDCYALQYIRHRLYFFMPFAILCALAAEGFVSMAGKRRKYAVFFLYFFIAAYALQNARTAIMLNNEQRSDDKMWQFLISAQDKIRDKYNNIVLHESWENSAVGMTKKYFFPKHIDAPYVTFFIPEYFLANADKVEEFRKNYRPVLYERLEYKPYFIHGTDKYEGQNTEIGFYEQIK